MFKGYNEKSTTTEEAIENRAANAPERGARRQNHAEAESWLRGENLSLGITLGTHEGAPVFQLNDDRFRHLAIVGRTGSGKSNHVLQMEREDIRAGAGVAIIAAHEEDALYPLACVPPERWDDVVIIDPTNVRLLPNLNPLDVDRADRAAVSKAVSDCVQLLKSQCHFEWAGPRFDHMARLGIETMLDPGFPRRFRDGTSGEPHIGLLERMFTDSDFVGEFMHELTDRRLFEQWKLEARTRRSSDADDRVAWFLAKVAPFRSDRVLRNMFGPGRRTIDVKAVVDEGKVLVAFIPEHRIGHDAAVLLRTWLLMQLEDAVMSRGAPANAGYYGMCARRDAPAQPDPFFVYLDEFGEHVTPQFASFLAEARTYRVGFTLAFQNLAQLRAFDAKTGAESARVLDAVLGNVGTMVCYPVGSQDAPVMARQLGVEERKVAGIRRYRPLVRACLGNEPRTFTLHVPPKPAPDDPALPESLAEEQIIRNVWLPAR